MCNLCRGPSVYTKGDKCECVEEGPAGWKHGHVLLAVQIMMEQTRMSGLERKNIKFHAFQRS